MHEHMEPVGYANAVGFVKSNPKNNDSYLAKCVEAYPAWAEILVETDRRLNEVVPGYNIAQIKVKFGGLRYYIDLPDGTSEEDVCAAYDIVGFAEREAPNLNS